MNDEEILNQYNERREKVNIYKNSKIHNAIQKYGTSHVIELIALARREGAKEERERLKCDCNSGVHRVDRSGCICKQAGREELLEMCEREMEFQVIKKYQDKIATLEQQLKESFEKGKQTGREEERTRFILDSHIPDSEVFMKRAKEIYTDLKTEIERLNKIRNDLEDNFCKQRKDYESKIIFLEHELNATKKARHEDHEREKDKIATLEGQLAGLHLQKFGEGVSFTEDRLWDFIQHKDNKPPETSFTSSKSREIARAFVTLEQQLKEALEENKRLDDFVDLLFRSRPCTLVEWSDWNEKRSALEAKQALSSSEKKEAKK